MTDEYLAMIKVSYQISPDDWTTEFVTKKLNAQTTIQDIDEWIKTNKYYPCGNIVIAKLKP